MSRYKDFTYYSHHHFENALNIGWENNVINAPKIDDLFLRNLIKYLNFPVNTIRGDSYGIKTVSIFGKEYVLGYSELRILDWEKGVKYAVPDIIIDRIIEGLYEPPIEFINAVNNENNINSIKYKEYISSYDDESLWGEDSSYLNTNEKILNIIKSGNLEEFRGLINKDNSLLEFVTKNGSILNTAISYYKTDIAKWILEENTIDINSFSGVELLTAIKEEEMEIIKILLDRKIIMYDDEIFKNPLFMAVSDKKEKATELLLKYTEKTLMKTYNNPYVKDMDIFKLAQVRGDSNIIELLEKYR